VRWHSWVQSIWREAPTKGEGDGETSGRLEVAAESLWQRQGTPVEAEEALAERGL